MSNKPKTKKVNQDAVPTLDVPVIEIGEHKNETPSRFVVVRGGLRVSDKEYIAPNEPAAIAEKEFWQRVVRRWPDGTKVEIVPFDKKRHRVW